jgi:hypothetical protein
VIVIVLVVSVQVVNQAISIVSIVNAIHRQKLRLVGSIIHTQNGFLT